jgi:hypothetical protein
LRFSTRARAARLRLRRRALNHREPVGLEMAADLEGPGKAVAFPDAMSVMVSRF